MAVLKIINIANKYVQFGTWTRTSGKLSSSFTLLTLEPKLITFNVFSHWILPIMICRVYKVSAFDLW